MGSPHDHIDLSLPIPTIRADTSTGALQSNVNILHAGFIDESLGITWKTQREDNEGGQPLISFARDEEIIESKP